MDKIEKIKNYLFKDGKFIQQRVIPKIFKKHFPEIYEKIKDNFNVKLYMLLNNIENYPKCPICNKMVNFKNFNEGFRTFCSNKCVNEHNKNNKEFGEKISQTMKKKFSNDYYLNKYESVKQKEGENFILVDDTLINKNKFTRLKDNEMIDSKHYFINNYSKFKHKTSEDWVFSYFPKTYNEIIKFTSETSDFIIKKFMFVYDIKKIPICENCNKNKVTFSNGFLSSCSKISCRMKNSKFEKEVAEFVNFLLGDTTLVIRNYRDSNKEIDIFIPSLNFGIECNGLYWHSDNYKDKKYHQDKKIFFKNKNINVFMIWEDDWYNKNSLIKSMLSYNLKKTKRIIYGRQTTIKIIDKEISRKFMMKNHIQKDTVDSIRIGLFYKKELVSVMTFGKRKFLNKSDVMELIRFATCIDTCVIGGANKLLKYFIETFKPIKIISYANLDISIGKLYETLNFNFVNYTVPGYWWSTNKYKSHRSNFIKQKLIKKGFDKKLTEGQIMKQQGFFKIYNSGNIKYELKIE